MLDGLDLRMERVNRTVAALLPGAAAVKCIAVERTADRGNAVGLRAFRTQKYVRHLFLSGRWIESKDRSAASAKLTAGTT